MYDLRTVHDFDGFLKNRVCECIKALDDYNRKSIVVHSRNLPVRVFTTIIGSDRIVIKYGTCFGNHIFSSFFSLIF